MNLSAALREMATRLDNQESVALIFNDQGEIQSVDQPQLIPDATVIIAREAHRGMVSAVSAVSAVLRTHGVLCNHISIPIFIHWINFHSCLIQQCSLDYWTVRFI